MQYTRLEYINGLFIFAHEHCIHKNATMNTSLRYFLTSTRLNRKWGDTGIETIKRRFCISSPAVVQEISKKVKQYGKLVIDVPWNVQVKSTDPHEYPDMDTLLVKLSSKREIDKTGNDLVSIDITNDCCRITASKREKLDYPSEAAFLVEAPIQYDIDVRTIGDSSVKVSSMVSYQINVETEKGNIIGAKLQGNQIILNSSRGGSIDLQKSLQGNIAVKTTENGSITAEKCLGTSLEMTTENGNVTLGSNYCEEAKFTTVNGNLSLNNLHMDSTVHISGNGCLNISCLDGSLQAQLRDGETKVQLVRLTGKSHIVSDGPVHLIVHSENNVKLNLKGHVLSVDESLNGAHRSLDNQQVFETNGEVPLHVETGGNLRVTTSSWAESLQLGKFMK